MTWKHMTWKYMACHINKSDKIQMRQQQKKKEQKTRPWKSIMR